MIQNIEPHVYRNEYVPESPKEDSVILYYEGRKILVKIEDQEISFLTFKEAAVYNPDVIFQAPNLARYSVLKQFVAVLQQLYALLQLADELPVLDRKSVV